MIHVLGTLKWLPLSLLLLVGIVEGDMTAYAENGRNFAGFLSVTEVVGGTEQVTLSLSLEIVNYSGMDITNATLRIEQGFPSTLLYQYPMPFDMAYRSRMVVTAPVLVIPRPVYDQWVIGMLPRFTVFYHDETGQSRSTGVELVPMIVDRSIQP